MNEPNFPRLEHGARPLIQNRKLLGIQYLRAVAAIAVVFYHASFRAEHPIRIGEAGVDLFFTLSGFLMIAITGPSTRPGVFLTDRAVRIIPAYWIVTTVVLAGALAGLFPNMKLEPWHVAASYAFIPAYNSNGDIWPLLVPGWTLNFEVVFYAVFAGTLFLQSQIRQMVLLTALFASLVLLGYFVTFATAAGRFYTNPIILEFIIGGWIGLGWNLRYNLFKDLGQHLIAFGIIAFLGAAFLNTTQDRLIIFGIPSAIMIAGFLEIESRGQIPKMPSLLLLGNASYSIYLWHTLGISVANKICGSFELPFIVTIFVGILSGIGIGLAAFWAIERPVAAYFQKKRRPFQESKPT